MRKNVKTALLILFGVAYVIRQNVISCLVLGAAFLSTALVGASKDRASVRKEILSNENVSAIKYMKGEDDWDSKDFTILMRMESGLDLAVYGVSNRVYYNKRVNCYFREILYIGDFWPYVIYLDHEEKQMKHFYEIYGGDLFVDDESILHKLYKGRDLKFLLDNCEAIYSAFIDGYPLIEKDFAEKYEDADEKEQYRMLCEELRIVPEQGEKIIVLWPDCYKEYKQRRVLQPLLEARNMEAEY